MIEEVRRRIVCIRERGKDVNPAPAAVEYEEALDNLLEFIDDQMEQGCHLPEKPRDHASECLKMVLSEVAGEDVQFTYNWNSRDSVARVQIDNGELFLVRLWDADVDTIIGRMENPLYDAVEACLEKLKARRTEWLRILDGGLDLQIDG